MSGNVNNREFDESLDNEVISSNSVGEEESMADEAEVHIRSPEKKRKRKRKKSGENCVEIVAVFPENEFYR